MKKIELLAPAGSFDALTAAVESGADAVYVGGSKFNARAFADNFDAEALKKAVEYAHIRGVKIYVTLNILVAEKELEEIIEYIGFLYSIDVDAVIVQDIALINIINKHYPDFEIHCSTQMTVHNTAGVTAYSRMGAKRVVLARELKLEEIEKIAKSSDTEIEVFVHGALCVSYSGQCLMSSMIGGRSGNRGRCAQPCRKKYSLIDTISNTPIGKLNKKYLISTRDLNTYKRLPEIIASGVTSLKIEGRMKRPEYVAVVVKSYREAIDKILHGNDSYHHENIEYELRSVFNREFTEGYIFNNRNKDIVSIERPDNRGVFVGKVVKQNGNIITVEIENNFIGDGDSIEIINSSGKTSGTAISGLKSSGIAVKKVFAGQKAEIFIREKIEINSKVNKIIDRELYQKALSEYSHTNKKKIPVSCKLIIKTGEQPVIKLSDYDGNVVSYSAEEHIQQALKIATTKEKVISNLNKTGDVPFYFESITMDIDEQCNVPARVINELRREALQMLSDIRAKNNHNRRNPIYISNKDILSEYSLQKSQKKPDDDNVEVAASVKSLDCAQGAIEAGADVIYIIYYWRLAIEEIRSIITLCRVNKRGCFILMPSISKDSELELIQQDIIKAVDNWNDVGIVISNIGQLDFALKYSPNKLRFNYTFNIFNSISANVLSNCEFLRGSENIAVDCINISPELNIGQIKDIAKNTQSRLQCIVYGHIPVMTTDYCSLSFIGNCNGCNNKENNYALLDERDKIFPIFKEGFCRSKILNSDVLFLIDELSSIKSSGISSLRADFYIESKAEVYNIIKLIKTTNTNTQQQRDIIHSFKEKGFTKGHFFRGVD